MKKDEILQKVISVDLTQLDSKQFRYNLPDVLDIYNELVTKSNLDEDLDRSHVTYSFCVFLAEEIREQYETLQVDLNSWAGKKAADYKSNSEVKLTDNDVKRKIESHKIFRKTTKKIIYMKKLYNQLIFGSARALDYKAQTLRAKSRNKYLIERGFSVTESDINDINEKQLYTHKKHNKKNKVASKIKNRM